MVRLEASVRRSRTKGGLVPPSSSNTAAAGFVATIADLDPSVHRHLVEASSLAGDERRAILDGLADKADVGALCEALLAAWDHLAVAERVGLLLVLAEALDRPNPPLGAHGAGAAAR